MDKYPVYKLPLSPERELRTLVENRKAYTLNNCELNIFETFKKSASVPLVFGDLVITSMLRGRKIMHLFGKPGFDYLPGETVIVPPTVRMEIDFPDASDSEPTQCTALAIDRKQISDTINYLNEHYPRHLNGLDWKLTFDQYHFFNNRELAVLINKLIMIGTSGELHKDILADFTLKELLIRIMQMQNEYELAGAEKVLGGSLFDAVVTYIRQHIHQEISVDDLCRIACMSKPSFFRAFKNEMGISPMEFVVRERIRHAKQLLAANLSIKEACFSAGFNSLNYFVRTFKRHEGITPGSYRLICE